VIYIPKYFKAWELVPNGLYDIYGDTIIHIVFDDRILYMADVLRETIGKPGRVNNYLSGGMDNWRGFRTQNSTVGAPLSQHRFGRALDISFSGIPSEEIIKHILDNREKYNFITRIEDEEAIEKVHIDCMWTGKEEIVLFKA